jgi:hypothetical protein
MFNRIPNLSWCGRIDQNQAAAFFREAGKPAPLPVSGNSAQSDGSLHNGSDHNEE